MIGAINKVHKGMSDKKEIESFGLTGAVITALENTKEETGLPKSEIVEFALRQLLGLEVTVCRNVTIKYFTKQ